MNTKGFLTKLANMLKEKSGIVVEIADDVNFAGGFYLHFPEFKTSVLRVNKDGKYNMRGVKFDGEKFTYPWEYKVLLPTDSTVEKLASNFDKAIFNNDKEEAKMLFPMYCYLSVLHQFYKRSLYSKKLWFEKYSDIEKRKFDKIRAVSSSLPSRQALRLLPQETQSDFIS